MSVTTASYWRQGLLSCRPTQHWVIERHVHAYYHVQNIQLLKSVFITVFTIELHAY